MMKVSSFCGGPSHYVAYCDDCDWDAGIHTKETYTSKDVKQAVRKHVLETGHRVVVEMARLTTYTRIENI